MTSPSPPSGTVTFLFTDIEGSTKRWEQYPQQMKDALQRHDVILRSAIEAEGGYVFKTMGDAFCAAFSAPNDALLTGVEAQRVLHNEGWGAEIGQMCVRMALHTGVTQLQDADYFGQPLNRVARLLSAGHGGQILLSLSTYELVRDNLPAGTSLQDMGGHRLKDLIRPEHVYQVVSADLPSHFPPLRTLDNHPNNLPVQLTPLVGREKEVAAICTLLHRKDVRLVTLTGPGGTGKTRLALQTAADMLDDFPDGVFSVELAALTDPALVPSTIAQTLGVTESASKSIIDSLKDYLADKHLLLVLDNFEQVAGASQVVDTLMRGVPHLKMLVTSRTNLNLYGEHEYAVPPLSMPDPKHLPSLERLTQYEAVRLFIERAQAVRADFEVTNDNAPAVAQICVRLDGLPLAIELAAARSKLFPPQALLSRLSNRMKLLTGGASNLPMRQQTLRAAIEWSYDLLNEGEKQFFRRMAVFQGGRTLEALEAVCNYDGQLEVDVLDGIESLVSKSLLGQREGRDGEPRLWMLETMHEYAREKLEESGEGSKLRDQHTLHFVTLVEQAEPYLSTAAQVEWFERLEYEHDNIRAALSWAEESGQIGMAGRLAGAIWLFWVVRGHWSEGQRALARILAVRSISGDVDGPSEMGRPILLKVIYGAGFVAWKRDEYSQARTLLEESLALSRGLGDMERMLATLNLLGRINQSTGDLRAAQSMLEEALSLSQEIGDKGNISFSLVGLGHIALAQQNHRLALSLYEQSLVLRRELADKYNMAVSLQNIGNAAGALGNYRLARSAFQEGVELSREQGNQLLLSSMLIGLGEVDLCEANYNSARNHFEEALRLRTEHDHSSGMSNALHSLGFISFHEGNHATATDLFTQSLLGLPEPKLTAYVAGCLVGLAGVSAVRGNDERAACLLGTVDALLMRASDYLWYPDQREYDAIIARVRSRLEQEAFERFSQQGAAMSMEEAIDYALDNSDIRIEETIEGV